MDITDAAVWSEGRRPNLGREFLAEVESTIARAAENPLRFPCLRRQPEVRRALTEGFPYRVFFIRRADSIVIFRVLHGARHDREWRSNIPSE